MLFKNLLSKRFGKKSEKNTDTAQTQKKANLGEAGTSKNASRTNVAEAVSSDSASTSSKGKTKPVDLRIDTEGQYRQAPTTSTPTPLSPNNAFPLSSPKSELNSHSPPQTPITPGSATLNKQPTTFSTASGSTALSTPPRSPTTSQDQKQLYHITPLLPASASRVERIQKMLEGFFDTEEERKKSIYASRRRGQSVVGYWRAELSAEQARTVRSYKYISSIDDVQRRTPAVQTQAPPPPTNNPKPAAPAPQKKAEQDDNVMFYC